MKTALIILLIVVVIAIFVLLRVLMTWITLTENSTVYRVNYEDGNYEVRQVIILSGEKYLADVKRIKPHIKYSFKIFLGDFFNHRILTEDQFDSID